MSMSDENAVIVSMDIDNLCMRSQHHPLLCSWLPNPQPQLGSESLDRRTPVGKASLNAEVMILDVL
jgi:hypothetical protein